MINNIAVYESTTYDPYYNLALEKYLLESVTLDTCILYLWQNENTVVIGRNQNPWAECSVSCLEEDHVKLARRLSGGGAVFHDLGNLNFTFLVSEENYDLDRQLSVIEAMCHTFKISAERSGRNDILVEGKKFSGNAFYNSKGRSYHHGTLLVNADMQKMPRYLNPSKAKLAAKGVSSVRSRVANLTEYNPSLTIESVKHAMKQAFSYIYGHEVQHLDIPEIRKADIEKDAAQMRDWDWLYGTPLSCTFACQEKFDWGEVSCNLNVSSGIIQECKVFTDAMDWTIAIHLECALTHCRFTISDITSAIRATTLDPGIVNDVITLLSNNL